MSADICEEPPRTNPRLQESNSTTEIQLPTVVPDFFLLLLPITNCWNYIPKFLSCLTTRTSIGLNSWQSQYVHPYHVSNPRTQSYTRRCVPQAAAHVRQDSPKFLQCASNMCIYMMYICMYMLCVYVCMHVNNYLVTPPPVIYLFWGRLRKCLGLRAEIGLSAVFMV